MRFLVVGGGAREHAIAATLHRAESNVYAVSSNANPGIERLAKASARVDPTDAVKIVEFARAQRVE
ncbi:MAG: phosphoribosylamine--glycine ligase, partial [Thermoplasmata archaeon]